MDSSNNESCPLISVGMPVYNGSYSFEKALLSILNQTFKKIEVIISDNNSDDETQKICNKYVKIDKRIKYYRQDYNIGGAKNFDFVLRKSSCEYFIWAASDDFRSLDFLEENYLFLKNNKKFVGSTSPNYLVDTNTLEKKEQLIDFSLEGEMFSRLNKFLDNAYISHGIYNSLFRRNLLIQYNIQRKLFLGNDWSINLFMLSHGPIKRIDKGYIKIGMNGISTTRNFIKSNQKYFVEFFFPFIFFSFLTLKHYRKLNFLNYIYLFLRLLILNLKAFKNFNL